MIEIRALTKRYRGKTAVDGLSFDVVPGRVTGFLGPNGSGKSTTMRVVVGLARATAGTARINGRRYADLPDPLRQVGVVLDLPPLQRGRTAAAHLLAFARSHRLPRSRVEEVLGVTGLQPVAGRSTGGFSLGMRQRLGIATALLGDPGVLILDEPTNGLDPDGVLWLRTLLTGLAAAGRTVLVSSHLMSEMALTAQQLVIIGRGRLVADTSVEELTSRAGGDHVLVRSNQPERLRELLAGRGATVVGEEPGAMVVGGMAAEEISSVVVGHGLSLRELTPRRASLEEAYMDITRDAVEFSGTEAGR
ncbi:ABC transporter ATP-binding protein [Actinophytocola xanthii]|uniref:Multidrug ABC transporter ATP-binding protein n=1 Tax=Actinophytocola xanthii TaxID=1912961 RepID=A0A1Q8CM37_9PSEU|nr:ATP-binding cassette domain-containing protein [Actinophytocola xanthii]OLF15427.1 multidrug ABC transporter ATP-binding protein [Actinophytocola xanthii]